MNDDDQRAADVRGELCPSRSESWPSPAPTTRCSIGVSFAGSAPARSRIARSLALSTVKLPEIWPEPPRIGSRITGAEITSLSSTMANGRPTFSCVTVANLRAPAVLKRNVHDRLAGALVEARLGVGQFVARHQHLLLNQDRRLGIALAFVKHFGIRRRPARQRVLRRHRTVDHAEFEFRGLADDLEQPLRIAEARHLHQHAVDALTLDRRFDEAELVDALLDDRHRLLDHLTDALGHRGFGHGEPDQPVARVRDIDRALRRCRPAIRQAEPRVRAAWSAPRLKS